MLDHRGHVLGPKRGSQEAAGIRDELEYRAVRERALGRHGDDRNIGITVSGEIRDLEGLATGQCRVQDQRAERLARSAEQASVASMAMVQ